MDIDLGELIDIRNQTESLGLETLASQIEVFLANFQSNIAENLNSRSDSQKTITWRHQNILVCNSKVFEAVLEVEKLDADIKKVSGEADLDFCKRRMELLDKIISVLWNATAVSEKDLFENKVTMFLKLGS